MAIATMTGSCPGVEQSSIQGGKLPSSSRSIKSGAMHLAPAPDIKELSNFLLLERSGIQVCSCAFLCSRPKHLALPAEIISIFKAKAPPQNILILSKKRNRLNTRCAVFKKIKIITLSLCKLHGTTKRLWPGFMNAVGKLRQKW